MITHRRYNISKDEAFDLALRIDQDIGDYEGYSGHCQDLTAFIGFNDREYHLEFVDLEARKEFWETFIDG